MNPVHLFSRRLVLKILGSKAVGFYQLKQFFGTLYLQVLHETALIEAFNLKAAIEYQLKNCKQSYSQNI